MRSVAAVLALCIAQGYPSTRAARPDAPVDGVVTAADGSPLGGVAVTSSLMLCCPAHVDRANTDGDGRFHLDHPGTALHFERDDLRPQAVVLGASDSTIRVSLEPASDNLVAVPCPANRKSGQELSGTVVRFRVSDSALRIVRGKHDTDYVVHQVRTRKGDSVLEAWLGPMAMGGEPEDDVFIDSSTFRQRHVVTTDGLIIGLDSRGTLKNGRRWRQMSSLGDGVIYRSAAPKDADAFDRVLDSVCTTFGAPAAQFVVNDVVFKPGVRIVLGEMHGTTETPRFMAALAQEAEDIGALRVGLEIPRDEQPRIDAYLRSNGSAADRAKLLQGDFWTREYQDGRSSAAMADLLESLRALWHQARSLQVIAFDIPQSQSGSTQGEDRDRAMAERLAAAFAKEPKATFLVLVGNLHARKTASPRFPQTFMAQRLAAMNEAILTLDVRYTAGAAWVCAPECGPMRLSGGASRDRRIQLEPTADGAYDGTFFIGAPTPSVPAARPLTEAQKKRLAELSVDRK